jgi:hypothetical protein
MSHRISLSRALQLRDNEIKSQDLNRQGLYKPAISRKEKRRRMHMTKTERFIIMLKERGGFWEQKQE